MFLDAWHTFLESQETAFPKAPGSMHPQPRFRRCCLARSDQAKSRLSIHLSQSGFDCQALKWFDSLKFSMPCTSHQYEVGADCSDFVRTVGWLVRGLAEHSQSWASKGMRKLQPQPIGRSHAFRDVLLLTQTDRQRRFCNMLHVACACLIQLNLKKKSQKTRSKIVCTDCSNCVLSIYLVVET